MQEQSKKRAVRHLSREYVNWKRPRAMLNLLRSRRLVASVHRPTRNPLYPVIAHVEVTVKCDLDCTFCQSKELRKSRSKHHMLYEQFQHIVDELDQLVNIRLIGMGEPTLHKDYFRMLNYAGSRGISTWTVTNCNRHTPEIAEQLVSVGLSRICISIDGATPQSYERARVGGSFERTIANLERLVRLRGSSKTPNLTVATLALDYNYRELPDLVRLCARIGVDELNVQGRPTDWGKDSYVEKSVAIGGMTAGDDFEATITSAKEIARESGILLRDHRWLYDGEHICPKPWDEIYISTTGEVVPCCEIADPRVVCMGNIFEQSFEEIWNGRRYVEFREDLLSNNIPRSCFACYKHESLMKQGGNGPDTTVTLPVLK